MPTATIHQTDIVTLHDAINPGCQDDLIKEKNRNIYVAETLVESLTDALTAITFDPGNTYVADINETNSWNNECEIY